jgi:hypothetical protein
MVVIPHTAGKIKLFLFKNPYCTKESASGAFEEKPLYKPYLVES